MSQGSAAGRANSRSWRPRASTAANSNGPLTNLPRLAEGIAPELIDLIRWRGDTAGLAEADAIVIDLAREIFAARHVSPQTFARALQQFGSRQLVDLVALMGNYAATAALLTAFAMQLDEHQPPRLPGLLLGHR